MTFTKHLTALEDPRHPVNIRHDFFDILFLTVSATLSQAEGWEDIICLIPSDDINQLLINCINVVRQSQGLALDPYPKIWTTFSKK